MAMYRASLNDFEFLNALKSADVTAVSPARSFPASLREGRVFKQQEGRVRLLKISEPRTLRRKSFPSVKSCQEKQSKDTVLINGIGFVAACVPGIGKPKWGIDLVVFILALAQKESKDHSFWSIFLFTNKFFWPIAICAICPLAGKTIFNVGLNLSQCYVSASAARWIQRFCVSTR